jgi:hypothetical protein
MVSGQLHAPAYFLQGKSPVLTEWKGGGWVGPRAGVDAAEKRKIHAPAGNRTQAVLSLSCRYIELIFK